MKSAENPYDELPYRGRPVPWTAPEALATVSLLHGGPRIDASRCRVLELGCANGVNLLPMAFYRPRCEFVGLDYSSVQLASARAHAAQLGLDNLQFVEGGFDSAVAQLEGSFDIIMAHGVFSWISEPVRRTLLSACQALLAPAGLLYLNYNARPGWNIRGMVRDFLLRHSKPGQGLAERALACQALAARVCLPLGESEHPYTQLMAREFAMVANQDPAYVAHEYLGDFNRPFWRREFAECMISDGFYELADAAFNSLPDRILGAVETQLLDHELEASLSREAADLLCYNQLNCPLLCRAGFARQPCSDEEFAALWAASPLQKAPGPADPVRFHHPDGREISAISGPLESAFEALGGLWPAAASLASLSAAVGGDGAELVANLRDDLEFLYAEELLTLRVCEPSGADRAPELLHELELALHGAGTTPWHTAVPTADESAD